jgi:hypothetical protein
LRCSFKLDKPGLLIAASVRLPEPLSGFIRMHGLQPHLNTVDFLRVQTNLADR